MSANPTAATSADPDFSYRAEIDGLRAVAVIGVFAFHLFPDACPGGFVGVDVFFVISGYLISRIIMTEVDAERFSLLSFYERRVRRILPALFGLLLGTSIGAAVLLPPTEYVRFADSARAAALSLSNFFFWRHTGYFELGSNSLPLLHTWSLAVEEQFYLAFPAIFLIGRRLRWSWATIILSMLALSLIASIVQTKFDPAGAFYLPITRAWEFLAGALVAARSIPRLSGRLAELISSIGLMLLVISVIVIDDRSPFPGWRALLPCVGSVAVIAAGNAALVAPLRSAACVFIGRISYSLYLWHWPLIVAARISWGGRLTIGEAGILAALAIALAYLSWRFVEEPPRRYRDLFTRRRLFAALAAIVIAAIVQTAAINEFHGLPSRYNVPAARFLADLTWTPPSGCGGQMDVCQVGAAGPPTFAVVGDSMALAVAPGIDLAARKRGETGLYLAKGGCLPLVGTGNASCSAFLQSAIGRIVAEPDVRTVLLIGRWTTAVEPRRFGRQNTRTAQVQLAQLAQAFTRTRAAFGRRRMLVLANIPEQPVDVPIAAADRANLHLAPFEGESRVTFDRRVARTDALLANILAPGDLLDASRAFCEPTVCIGASDGRSLYSDDNHPNVRGALYLAERGVFDPLFNH